MLNRSFFIQIRSFSNSVGILGVPFSKGQKKQGVELAPTILRQAGLVRELKEYLPDLSIKDYGDIKYKPSPIMTTENVLNWGHVTACNQMLSKEVQSVIQHSKLCVTLGGDHSIGLGSVHGHLKGLEKKNLAVLWVDAHADINTIRSSPSGSCHGMPVSMLVEELQESWSRVSGLEWKTEKLPIKNIGYIGLRSVDGFEKEVIRNFGVTAFGMDDVEHFGIHQIIKMVLDKIDPSCDRSLHVSFDIDSLDVFEAPSTGTPVRGGLTLREGIAIMQAVHKTKRLRVMDLVEVNPAIGTVGDVKTTVEAAKQIILAALGYRHCI